VAYVGTRPAGPNSTNAANFPLPEERVGKALGRSGCCIRVVDYGNGSVPARLPNGVRWFD